MEIHELLHKRILTLSKERYGERKTVEELKILEISPSGNWTKVQNMNGNKYWIHSSDIVPVEVLAKIEIKPKL